MKQAHGDAHPKQLRCLDAALLVAGVGAIDNQVTIVKRLDAEIIKLQVGGGIERRAEFPGVVLQQVGTEALDLHAVPQVLRQIPGVRLLQRADTVAEDVPIEHLLVNISAEQPAGEPRKVSVTLHQHLGVQEDCCLQFRRRHLAKK